MSEVGYEDPSSLTQGERDREEFLDAQVEETRDFYTKKTANELQPDDPNYRSTGQIVQGNATKEHDRERSGQAIMITELGREAMEWGYNSPMMTAGQRPDPTVVANEYLQQFGDFTMQDIIDTAVDEYRVDQEVIDWMTAAPGEEVRQNWLARNVSPVLTGIIRAHEGFQVSADEVPVQIGWESDLNPLIEATPDWHDARGILGDKDSLANLILPTSPEEAAAFFGMYLGTGVILNGVVRGSRFLQAAAQQRRWSGQWPYNPLEGELVPAWMGPQSQSRLTGAGVADDFIDGAVVQQRALSAGTTPNVPAVAVAPSPGRAPADLVPIPLEVTQWGPPKAPELPRPQSPLELLQFGPMNRNPDPGFGNREILENINFENLYRDYTADIIEEYFYGGTGFWKAVKAEFKKTMAADVNANMAESIVRQFFLSRNSRNTIRARTLVGLESTGTIDPETGVLNATPYGQNQIDPIETLNYFVDRNVTAHTVDETNVEAILELVKNAIASISQSTLRAAGVGETLTVYRFGDANNRNASVTMYPNLFTTRGGHRWNDPARDELEAYEINLEDVLVTIDARSGRSNYQAELIVDPAVLEESVTAQNLIRDRAKWEREALDTFIAASPSEKVDTFIRTLEAEGIQEDPADALDLENLANKQYEIGGFDSIGGFSVGKEVPLSPESLVRTLNINIEDALNTLRGKIHLSEYPRPITGRGERMKDMIMDWDPSLDISVFPLDVIRSIENLERIPTIGEPYMLEPLSDIEIEIIKEIVPQFQSGIVEILRSYGLNPGSSLEDGRLIEALKSGEGSGRVTVETDFGTFEISSNQEELLTALENRRYARLSEEEQYEIDMQGELEEQRRSGDGDYERSGTGDWFFEGLPSWHPLSATNYRLRLF